ncbi:MAG TPA: hypothetical protein VK003_11195 [Oceanobacillus sp.]|nr:hypothetical protein [Oceanobacillus sp.]
MADKANDKQFEEDEHRVDKAEGQRDPGKVVTKVSGTPDQAEGDREKIEENLKQKASK